jgi:hypothetical protein
MLYFKLRSSAIFVSVLLMLAFLPLRAEELVRSRVAILAMHEPRDLSYYNDLRRSVYERWSLRAVRGLERLTGLSIDGSDWTFRGVALLLLVFVTFFLFLGFTNTRRRTFAYSTAFGLLLTMVGWIFLYSGVASLNQFDMRGAHHVQKVLDVTTSWGMETDVYWEWEPFLKQWEVEGVLPYTVVCWLGVPLGADQLQMESWITKHKDQRFLQFCLGAQLPRIFHQPLFGKTEPFLDWSPNSARSVCEPQSAYERSACWQIPNENCVVKSVPWYNNVLMYGRGEADPLDVERWLTRGLEQLGQPWCRLNTQGIGALRLDDPGSALNAYLESWSFPTLSPEHWRKVEATLTQFNARMTIGYVPAWMDDGEETRGSLEVDGQKVSERRCGQVYPSANVVYRPQTSSEVYDYKAQADFFKTSKACDLELHGFTHITPEVERWSQAPNRYGETDWYREFLGTEQRPFVQRSDVVQKELMQKGRQWFFGSFGFWPTTLIPPGHAISWDTAEIAFRENFAALCDRHMVLSGNGQVRRSRLWFAQELAAEKVRNQRQELQLPKVFILHDKDFAHEPETWLAEQLARWKQAGIEQFVSVRELADMWMAMPRLSQKGATLVLETQNWPELLAQRILPHERVSLQIHCPQGLKMGVLPEGLQLDKAGMLSYSITGLAQTWEIPLISTHD